MPQAWIMGSATELKAVGLDQFFSYMAKNSEAGNVTHAYKAVAWAYRCVQLRCNALAGIPWAVARGETEQAIAWPMETLLWKAEAAMLMYGAAFLLKTKAKYPLNGKLQWLNPATMRVITDQAKGIVGFEQTVGATARKYAPEEMVYFHSWNPDDDLGPGVAPMSVALAAAGLASNANTWASKFFENGAIPSVILTTDQNPPDNEIDRVRTVWKQMYRGVQNAFRTAILRYGLKPTIIGSPIKDLAMKELMSGAREQIGIAFGVPASLLGDEAANYATASEGRAGFWQDTIVPEATLIQATINEQLFEPLGMEFKFHLNEVKALQEDETKRAQALSALVNAKVKLSIAMQMLGYDLPEGVTWEDLEGPEPEPPKPIIQIGQPGAPQAGQAEQVAQEMRKWRNKARKRGPCDFESDIIPQNINDAVKSFMAEAGVERAFAFLKSVPEGMDEAAGRLRAAIARVLAQWAAQVAEDIVARRAVELGRMADSLKAALLPELTSLAMEQALREMDAIGVAFDPAVINTAASAWARAYAGELITGLTETTRGLVEQAIAQYVETPGMTLGDLERLLEPAFGPARAEMIAITEVTRAYSQATQIYQEMLGRAGLKMERVWHTSVDDRVCEICGPLDGKPESQWGGIEPPAHVRCRCWTTLRMARR